MSKGEVMTDARSSTVPLSHALESGTAGHPHRITGHSAGQWRDRRSEDPETTGTWAPCAWDSGGTKVSQAACCWRIGARHEWKTHEPSGRAIDPLEMPKLGWENLAYVKTSPLICVAARQQ